MRSHNLNVFDSSTTVKAIIDACDIIIGDVPDELKEKIKQKIPEDPSRTMRLHSAIAITAGGKYDLTTNVSVSDGMTNGAECALKEIDYKVENCDRPTIIWVLFDELDVGKCSHKENGHLFEENRDKNWTPILDITRQLKISNRSNICVLRRQFPLRPAAAKTIHRSQGDTLDQAVVDFLRSTRTHALIVGLSRVRNISNLRILNLNEQKISVSKKVKAEMARLRMNAILKRFIPFLYQYPDASFLKILFQNVHSLHLHLKDFAADYNIQAAHVNILVETALCLKD